MRIKGTILLLVLGVAAGAAEETPATAAPAASPERGIAGARAELDAIKALRAPVVPSKSELSGVTTPQLQIEDGSPIWSDARTTRRRLEEAEKKSKNWLVEAMEKDRRLDSTERESGRQLTQTEGERILAARDELRPQGEGEIPAGGLAAHEAEMRAAETRKEQSSAPERPPLVTNPLDTFMAGWMTPQDFSLLRPGSTDRGLERGVATDVSAAALPGYVTSGVGATTPGLAGDELGRGVFSTAPASTENPYLQALVLPGPADTMRAPVPPIVQPAPAPVSTPVYTPPPAGADSARSKIPDFARPPVDEKYFKQLKRF